MAEDLVNRNPHSIYYFEVKILKAGSKEDIIILVEGTGVIYQTINGKVKINSLKALDGSYNMVGIGITPKHKAFLTYNGLIVFPVFHCEFPQHFRPKVIMNGSDCEVQIELRSWIFGRELYVHFKEKTKKKSRDVDLLFDILGKEMERLKKKNRKIHLFRRLIHSIMNL